MFLAFGEIMARIAPPGTLRWRQALPGAVQVTWGGGEANVCASLALLGQKTRYLTALPRTPIAEAVVASLRGLGVDTDQLLWRKEGRLGLYFVEGGANQRGSTVIYDRSASAASLAGPEEYDFQAALAGVKRLHVTGITPAISEAACRANLEPIPRNRARPRRRITLLPSESGCQRFRTNNFPGSCLTTRFISRLNNPTLTAELGRPLRRMTSSMLASSSIRSAS